MKSYNESSSKVWVSFNPDPDRPQVQIYGNPAGLMALASKLIEMAESVQKPIGHDRVDHDHVFPGRGVTLQHSIEIVLGRMDDRETGDTTWFEENLEFSKTQLIKQLQRLADNEETNGV